jgi:hypothetical protein
MLSPNSIQIESKNQASHLCNTLQEKVLNLGQFYIPCHLRAPRDLIGLIKTRAELSVLVFLGQSATFTHEQIPKEFVCPHTFWQIQAPLIKVLNKAFNIPKLILRPPTGAKV